MHGIILLIVETTLREADPLMTGQLSLIAPVHLREVPLYPEVQTPEEIQPLIPPQERGLHALLTPAEAAHTVLRHVHQAVAALIAAAVHPVEVLPDHLLPEVEAEDSNLNIIFSFSFF